MKRTLALVVCAALVACGDRPPADAVAVAADHVLTVDETVALLADHPQIPAERDVVAQVADLWIDYTLLAETAGSDSALGALDLSSVVRPQLERELVQALRQQAVQVDTVLAEDQLRALYEQELPGARVHARHILLQFDRQREASRDSAVALAQALKRRAEGGESFAALARQYSTDTGSASDGGDLGFFERQTMVPAFSQVAFALAPGQVSEPVITEFGVHVIRVDERQVAPFDTVREAFANAVKNRRVGEAEQAFVRSLQDSADLAVQAGAADAARELAADVPRPLPRAERERVLVRYAGGALTVGDLQAFLLAQPRALRVEMIQATDEQMEPFLEGVTRGRLLIDEARRRGIETPEALRNSLTLDARVQLVTVADQLGLRDLGVDGPGRAAAVDSAVTASLDRIIRGEGEFVELAALSVTLREAAGGRLVEPGLDRALETLREERRARAPESSTTGEAGLAPPLPGAALDSTAAPDTTGGTR
ncbi:MAG: peptidylprolyl isomerase [Gemmatimonadota bacterium]|nr:peptidyl-prolyl cis-trans isomerase [Gemmatimonadota bacterium]